MTDTPLECPTCGDPSEISRTKYGRRDHCPRCGLHSWHGKPMVSQEIHEARKHCHEIFDRLWKDAETMYGVEEAPGTEDFEVAVSRIRRSARARAYRFIAFHTGYPEPECHMAEQTSIDKLRAIYREARAAAPERVRSWWKETGETWWAAQVEVDKERKKAERKAKRPKKKLKAEAAA